ncbi:MAG: hypothetical protein KIS77_16925 [Saprospiraceae bacterium]|nr:hypothetical protein [Saprospiraceae bacterium]
MNVNANYYLGLIVISVFSALALFSIWRHILRHGPIKGKKDYGLAYLAGAMGVWAVVGVWSFMESSVSPLLFEVGFSLLSTINSLLYLLAIQHFDYSPDRIRQRWWQPIVLSIAGLVAASTLMLFWYSNMYHIALDEAKNLLWWPDVLFSLPTIFALGIGFWRSFYYRGYKLLAWLSSFAMVIILLVQLPEVSSWLKSLLGDSEKWLTLTSYGLLMMLCFALATSWGVEEFSLPHPTHLRLFFEGKEKYSWVVHLKIRDQRYTAFLSPMNFKNLLLFAARRITSPENGWVHLDEDLNGYNYFRRILLDFSKAWQEVNQADEDNESVQAIRRILFEYGNPGQYRLKIEPSNMNFEEALFEHREDLVKAMQRNTEKKQAEALFNNIREWMDAQEKTPPPTPQA